MRITCYFMGGREEKYDYGVFSFEGIREYTQP